MLTEDVMIERVKRTKPYSMKRDHYHEEYEIYYLLAGERTYYVESLSYELKKGCLLFIKKNAIHKTVDKAGSSHERTLVYFKERFIAEYGGESRLELLLAPFQGRNLMLQLSLQEQSYVESLLFHLEQEYAEAARLGRDINMGAMIIQLLVFSSRKMTELPANKSKGPMDPKVAEIIAYCQEHFDKPLRLETISSLFYISPFHFIRLFKKNTGFTFTEYLNTVRIREAQRLLRETKVKMIVIAGMVGFANVSHFNRKFKEVTQMSPKEYRKMVQ